MRARDVLAGLAVLAAVPALAQEPEGERPVSAPPPGVTLTGYWRLDPDLSDDPGQVVSEARGVRTDDAGPVRGPTSPGRRGMPGDPGTSARPGDPGGSGTPTGPGVDMMTPGVTGTGGSGDPFRRGSSGSGSSDARAAFGYVLDMQDTLTIAQRPSLILIQEGDDEGRVRGLRPDGVRYQAPGGRAASRTRWEKGRLRVETWREDGVDVEEAFELAPDKSRLTVIVSVVEGGISLTLERVFLPDEADDR